MSDLTNETAPPKRAVVEPEQLLAGLRLLREAWSQTNAGKGGYSALSGFEYQITRAISEIIRSEATGGGLVLMEVLSDIVREEGGLVVAQLKRTLSSGALSKALDELWQIEKLARSETPGIRPAIRYEVQASRRELKDSAASLRSWTPKASFDLVELSEFKDRVGVSVTPDPRLEAAALLVEFYRDPRPFDTIDRFSGKLLRSTDNAATEQAASELRMELASLRASSVNREIDFRIWRADDQPPQTIEYEPDKQKAVRVGQRLGVSDLVAGRLAARTVYSTLHEEAEEWLQSASNGSDKIPVFWIEGRSGAGKSAALLHLIAKLQAEDPRRVAVWLGSRADRFGEAVRRFSDLSLEGRQVIFAIDDPLSPAQQAGFTTAVQRAAEEWVRLSGLRERLDGEAALTPVLICCGPTEQREFGDEAFYAELEITTASLPKENEADLEELAAWYYARTGTKAPDLSGDVLLVQRFFEWNQGNIKDFALRFKQRLLAFTDGQEGEVFDAVAKILAFGRLYADYPATALSAAMDANDRLARAFEQLASTEDHLVFTPDGAGVRMTHPHLADAIYREWFGNASHKFARKRHLAEGLRASLGRAADDPEVRLAPLWAIARLVRAQLTGRSLSEDVRERTKLIDGELRDLLPEIYAELLPEIPVLSGCPVWLILDEALALNLTPSPLEKIQAALSSVSVPERGLRLSCHLLLDSSFGDDSESNLAIVANTLIRLVDWREEGSGLPWREWSILAEGVVRGGGYAAIHTSVLRLIERAPRWKGIERVACAMVGRVEPKHTDAVAVAWLTATQDTEQHWGRFLRLLLDAGSQAPDIDRHAFRFLLTQPRSIRWVLVWESLRASGRVDPDKLQSLALCWLGVRSDLAMPAIGPDGIGYGRLLSLVYGYSEEPLKTEIEEICLEWLNPTHFEEIDWSYLWIALWNSDSKHRSTLSNIGRDWLRHSTDHGGWSFVWQEFAKTLGGTELDDLLVEGMEWLERVHPTHSGWNWAWETLLIASRRSRRISRRDVLGAAERWLSKAPHHRGWPMVWQNLAEDDEYRIAMLDVGRSWLLSASIDHPAWRYVARHVVRAVELSSREAEHIGLAASIWLRRNQYSTAWAQVFEFSKHLMLPTVMDAFRRGVLLDARAGGERFNPPTVRSVLTSLDDASQADDLMSSIIAWLEPGIANRDWATAFQIAATADPPRLPVRKLLELAEARFARISLGDVTWPYLWPTWRRLLKKAGRIAEFPQASECSLVWLCVAPIDHKRWTQIYGFLALDRRELLDNEDLVIAQRKWLGRRPKDQDDWGLVLSRYVQVCPSWKQDDDLVQRILELIDGADRGLISWPGLWSAALDVSTDKQRLLEQASEWLNSNSASPKWVFVWRRANWAARSDALGRQIVRSAQTWLQATPIEHADWLRVYEQYARNVSSDTWPAEFVDHLLVQLTNTEDDSARRTIWTFLRRANGTAERAGSSVLKKVVLSVSVTDPQFTFLWSSFTRVALNADRTEDVAQLGMDWLAASVGHHSWAWVWRDLWAWHEQRPTLRSLGHDWLKGNPQETNGYHVVRAKLFPPARRQG